MGMKLTIRSLRVRRSPNIDKISALRVFALSMAILFLDLFVEDTNAQAVPKKGDKMSAASVGSDGPSLEQTEKYIVEMIEGTKIPKSSAAGVSYAAFQYEAVTISASEMMIRIRYGDVGSEVAKFKPSDLTPNVRILHKLEPNPFLPESPLLRSGILLECSREKCISYRDERESRQLILSESDESAVSLQKAFARMIKLRGGKEKLF